MKAVETFCVWAGAMLGRRLPAWLLFLGGLGVGWEAAGQPTNALHLAGGGQFVQLPLGEEVIVDGLGAGFSVTGPWVATGDGDAYGGGSLSTTEPAATARWNPVLRRAATYEVFAWWSGSGQDAEAQYLINHAGGLARVKVDQSQRAGGWVSLGSYAFAANGTEYVILQPGSGVGGATIADAVRFAAQAFDLTTALTVEAWVRVDAFDAKNQNIMAKGKAWGLLRHESTDRVTFRTEDGAGVHDLVSSVPLVPGRWHHVAAVFDGSAKHLYIDGANAVSAALAGPLPRNRFHVLLGDSEEVPGVRSFKGDLDSVRIWGVARTAEEVGATMGQDLRGNEEGLLGDWRFDEVSGLVARDSSWHGFDGTLFNLDPNTSRVEGVPMEPSPGGELALRFDGAGQHVGVVADARHDFAGAMTVETWVYFDRLPVGTAALVSKGSDAWELALGDNGKLIFRTAGTTNAAGSAAPELVSNAALGAGVWHQVAAVWDGRVKSIYLNGVLDRSQPELGGQMAVSSTPVLFGARPGLGGTNGFFGGILDEVRLWSVARSPAEVLEHYSRRLNGNEPFLEGWWRFDEGSGSMALDSGRVPALAGALEGGMTSLNRVPGRSLSGPLPPQNALRFDGLVEYVGVADGAGVGEFDLTNLTMEAWVRPELTGFGNGMVILMKGDQGYGLGLDADFHLRYFIDSQLEHGLRSARPLRFDLDGAGRRLPTWNHVGVVVDGAARTTTFYINGSAAGSHGSAVVINNAGALILGRQGSVATANYFRGVMDEVRVWRVARTGLEVDLFAFIQLMDLRPEGLVAYWSFNEGQGTVLGDQAGRGHDGTLFHMDQSNWTPGHDFGVPPLPAGIDLTGDPASAGLWVGDVVVSEVNEVQRAINGVSALATETADRASLRLLLHVSGSGQVRLLKDVIVMTRSLGAQGSSGANPQPAVVLPPAGVSSNIVLVTDPALIPGLQGVVWRGGKLVGLRYGTAAYDFDGWELPVVGGLGQGRACFAQIDLGAGHPTNPYRHKYHPDHRAGLDIVRQLTLRCDGVKGTPLPGQPEYGVSELTGRYEETIVGLHKIPLQVRGQFKLSRVSLVGVLNGAN